MDRGLQVVNLGRTEVPAELRQEFLLDLSDRYTPEKYSLLHNNCNNFRRADSACSYSWLYTCPHAPGSDLSILYYASTCSAQLRAATASTSVAVNTGGSCRRCTSQGVYCLRVTLYGHTTASEGLSSC